MTIAEYPLEEENGLNAGDPRDDDIRRQFALEIDRAALANSLDMLSLGIFLVDATGRIIHANVSGRIMLSEATVMRGLGGNLGTIDPQANQALLEAFAAAGGGDPALGRKGIAVALKARGNARYVANVLPLELGAQGDAGVSGAAVAAVFVHKAVLDLTSLPEVIAKEYGLTPAELRVLFAIIEVGGVGKVAKVLGSSQATVKTHLRHLFKKTGTSRQAELVKLMTTYVCDEVLRGQVVR
ncbi:MAG TPA: LuxR family transcriptional regulator [Xanthobacteraceae bacterium]|nr:LuxR family transcriptional regulator [Xanthobacteraceae bacterium]